MRNTLDTRLEPEEVLHWKAGQIKEVQRSCGQTPETEIAGYAKREGGNVVQSIWREGHRLGIKSLISSSVVKKVLDNLGDNFRLSGKERQATQIKGGLLSLFFYMALLALSLVSIARVFSSLASPSGMTYCLYLDFTGKTNSSPLPLHVVKLLGRLELGFFNVTLIRLWSSYFCSS